MEDDLLTAREAEDFTGLRYGYLERMRRMVKFVMENYPSEPEKEAAWRARTPPWTKVGNRIMYRRGDLAPFMTNRAGVNRHGTCRTCRFFQHESWERDSEYFDPERATCTWARGHITAPENAPPWLPGAIRPRINAKGGRTCAAFQPSPPNPSPQGSERSDEGSLPPDDHPTQATASNQAEGER